MVHLDTGDLLHQDLVQEVTGVPHHQACLDLHFAEVHHILTGDHHHLEVHEEDQMAHSDIQMILWDHQVINLE